MTDEDDAPKLARDVTHARIGNLLFDLREVVNDIISLRLNPVGSLLIQDEEGELMAIKNSLDWLLSDIRESRPNLKIVKNG